MSQLGFGLMRLPRKGLTIDIEQTKAMVDLFLAAGFTYFDTAYIYLGSEDAARRALVERHPRQSYTLATKLNAMLPGGEKAAKKQLRTSLERTGAGYFDYYLLHSLMENGYQRYDRFHLWDYVRELKEQGLVKHWGFSFHAGPELLDRLLTEHPDVDFVQLQINYADWDSPSIAARANYEVARRHNKPIVIMEPVKGGALAKPPRQVRELLRQADPAASCASWALRFAASLEGVLAVLSGMSDLEQMRDNLSFMTDFKPLNAGEYQIIRAAQGLLGESSAIPCTACRYCVEGCPRQIPIPDIFSAANLRLSDGQIDAARRAYAQSVPPGHGPADCIACGHCEQVCPQHIPIVQQLKQCGALLKE